MPEIRLSADIIVGYPGETEEEFGETLSALAEIRFANIFSFCYSPRPLTAAVPSGRRCSARRSNGGG